MPYVLGTRPRFVLEGIGHGWRRHVTYQVRSDVRGRFDIGPMTVRVSDPFGLVELGPGVPDDRAPHRHAADRARCRASRSAAPGPAPATTGRARSPIGSAEDVTVREYRRGDDLRRVHWRSSARVGELMVRREEQPWQSRATLFLDNRVRAHRGQGIASSLEAAVSVAASIAVHLSHRGFTVRLVTAAGEDPSSAWHVRDTDLNTAPLLEALAVVAPTPAPVIDTGWLTEHGGGGLVVAVVGGLTAIDIPVLRRMQHHAGVGARGRARRRRLGVPGGVGTGGARRPAHPAGLARRTARAAGPARERSGRSSAAARPRARARGAARFRQGRDDDGGDSHMVMPRSRTSLVSLATLSTLGAATTWVALLSWRGFTELSGHFLGPLLLLGIVMVGTGILARWWRAPGPVVVVAQVGSTAVLTSMMLTGSPLPVGSAWTRLVDSVRRRSRQCQPLRATGARRGARRRPAADRRRPGPDAARRLPGLHPAPGAARRAAAAHRLQRPREHARVRPSVVGLRVHRGRLPDHAVPARGRAGLPLGPVAGTREGRHRRRHLRGADGGGARERRHDRRRGDGARGRRAGG